MTAQLFALLTALAFAVSNVSVRRGFRYSTPLTATFVSLLIHSIMLWMAVFVTGEISQVALAGVVAIVAAYWPARRMARKALIVALRYE